jgi:cell division protein FtsB
MLRNDPDFQDDVARKELGYGKKDEKVFRFTK